MNYKSIILALSCSGNEKELIKTGISMSDSFNIPLKLVHVNDPLAGQMSMMMDSGGHKYTEVELMELISSNKSNNVSSKILTDENIPEALASYVNKNDLLILGHKKMNKLKEKITDSIDQNIVNQVYCHTLVVKI